MNYNKKLMPKILQNHYVLAVQNARAEADFYIDKLGFSEWGDAEGWVFVEKDNCAIMIGDCPDQISPRDLGDHSYFGYLRVDDADAFYEDLKEKGAELLSPIADEPWGMREFTVRTPGGHRFKIGQWIGGEEKKEIKFSRNA